MRGIYWDFTKTKQYFDYVAAGMFLDIVKNFYEREKLLYALRAVRIYDIPWNVIILATYIIYIEID